jgi:hypothetical protein
MKREKRSGMYPLRIYLPKKVCTELEKEADRNFQYITQTVCQIVCKHYKIGNEYGKRKSDRYMRKSRAKR